ncbi:MAG TPA: MlaE family lipid ABC transporter permease subunit [Verrucomicrobiota bacterium]|nr:MlaE family lipid ABC transporter permease subunit [Verrucomicrobiota bacterium]
MRAAPAATGAEVRRESTGGAEVLRVAGRLDVNSVGAVWSEALALARRGPAPAATVDASGVTYLDGAGAALLVALKQEAGAMAAPVTGLAEEWQRLFALYDRPGDLPAPEPPRPWSVPAQVGRVAVAVAADVRDEVSFLGEVAAQTAAAARRRGELRWRDVTLIAERAGADALPIVTLVCFLIGVVLAFQSAIPLRQFGADIFVPSLVAFAILRELGPLMAAIMLAGRSGSAFAAEIGTMKINQELSALQVMNLDPVRFLAVPRLLAGVVVAPLVTIFANLAGLLGGAVVFVSLGFPLFTYWSQIRTFVDAGDLMSGLIKSVVFGLIVAGVGCLRGFQTERGPSAVGLSATRAVVTSILLIIVADGIFAVVYHQIGL